MRSRTAAFAFISGFAVASTVLAFVDRNGALAVTAVFAYAIAAAIAPTSLDGW